jgi:hypothetical protein
MQCLVLTGRACGRAPMMIAVGSLLAFGMAGPGEAATVSGTLLFEKIPVTLQGLNAARPVNTPAARIRVEVRSSDQTRVYARGVTSDSGGYRLTIPERTGPVVLAVFAESGKMQVGDPATRRLFGMTTAPFQPSALSRQVLIPAASRQSGPFNILAALVRANARLAQIDPEFPLDQIALTVYWSPTQRQTYFQASENAIYLRGVQDENTDEFDDAVILHEYAHYLTRLCSRDDTFGGAHYPGDRLDPRQAWSEGAATFLALALLGTSVYIDTLGPRGAQVFAWDMEEDAPEWDLSPGYWSEHSVGSALWDFCAEPGIESDHVGLGLQPIWKVYRGYLPSQVFIHLIHMADGLVAADPSRDGAVTAVLAKRNIAYRYGVVPSVPVPFPRLIAPGDPVTGSVDSSQSRRYNLYESADFYRFQIGTPRHVTIDLQVTAPNARGAADLMLVLYDAQGRFLAFVDEQHGVGSRERVLRDLPAGTYVIGVWSYRWTGSTYLYDGAKYRLTAEF